MTLPGAVEDFLPSDVYDVKLFFDDAFGISGEFVLITLVIVDELKFETRECVS